MPEIAATRKAQVEALRTERDFLSRYPSDHRDTRLAQVDAALATFDDEPSGDIEKAVPSTTRGGRGRRGPAPKAPADPAPADAQGSDAPADAQGSDAPAAE